MISVAGLVSKATVSWHGMKTFIEHATRIEHGALHVIVGVMVWLLVSLLSRRSISSWVPWVALLVLILWNEAVDLMVEQWPQPAMQYGEGARDVLLTMFLPTLLMFSSRFFPRTFGRR